MPKTYAQRSGARKAAKREGFESGEIEITLITDGEDKGRYAWDVKEEGLPPIPKAFKREPMTPEQRAEAEKPVPKTVPKPAPKPASPPKAAKKPTASAAADPDKPVSGQDNVVIQLMNRKKGASLVELAAETGWSTPYVEWVAWALRSQRGLPVVRKRASGGHPPHFTIR
jgi:outer membrane biosynthesis protein TonB